MEYTWRPSSNILGSNINDATCIFTITDDRQTVSDITGNVRGATSPPQSSSSASETTAASSASSQTSTQSTTSTAASEDGSSSTLTSTGSGATASPDSEASTLSQSGNQGEASSTGSGPLSTTSDEDDGSDGGGSSDLGAGAIAGIVIGSVGVVAITVLAIVLARRRKSANNDRRDVTNIWEKDNDVPAREMDGRGVPNRGIGVQELEGNHIREIEGSGVAELSTSRDPS
jgi:hypothetical protein